MNEVMTNHKGYFLAILMPALFFAGIVVYLSNFEVPVLAQVQFSPKKVEEPEGQVPPAPNVWDKVKDKENPVAKELVVSLVELQKEADLQLDVEKVYNLQEMELLNVKMGEQIQKIQKLERNFYFPPSTAPQETITLDDIEVLGIFYGRANLKVSDEIKERLVKVGDTLKKGKVRVLEIRSDAVVFSVEGKKVEKTIKK